MNKKELKNGAQKCAQKGITLIALVITIIVMLILVAVTISMAINGGLFGYAGKATGETQNAIGAEQQLASGKVKIDGKWYASIDDYINNKPIESGIEIDLKEITLKKKESEEVEGEEKLTETITASVFGMESEPEITWETSSDAITLSATTGKSVKVTAVGTENTEVTVTAKCTHEGEEYTVTSKILLEILKNPIEVSRGVFVEYGVSYTDAFISEDYTTTNGWRLLDYTDNGDGTISNVKLISTGIPAMLHYSSNSDKSWFVTDNDKLTSFKEVLGGENYTFYTGDYVYKGLYASAGMYYNFGDIKFAYGTVNDRSGKGYFTSITVHDGVTESGTTYNVDNTTEKTGNELFKVGSNVETVRLLTLKEVNEALNRTDIDTMTSISTSEDSTGLYRLDQLSVISGMSKYSYTNGMYWVASPWPYAAKNLYICHVEYGGDMDVGQDGGFRGVRPVVFLESGVNFAVDSERDDTMNVTYLKLSPKE